VDYIWFSGNSLDVKGVMETVDADKIKDGVPNVIFPSDHLSLKAVFGFK
jgi:mRNA deadenylase 3'-5' endonuclease subunit Ccr4